MAEDKKNLFTTVHHVAIIVADYEKTKEFYIDKLGFEIVRENFREDKQDWKLDLTLNGCELEIFEKKNAPKRVTNPEACGMRHLAFAVDNIEEAVAVLNEKGIATEPIRMDPYSNKPCTFFYDPDGLPLELHE